VSELQLLAYHGADLSALDVQGNTCLHAAAHAGHVKCLAAIINAGGDYLLEEKDIGVSDHFTEGFVSHTHFNNEWIHLFLSFLLGKHCFAFGSKEWQA